MNTNSGALILPSAPAPASTQRAEAGGDLRDIKGPVEMPGSWAWMGWVLLGAAVALAAWLMIRFWLRRRRQRTSAEIRVPPHIRARHRLNAALPLIHDPKPFCIAVSDALRIYLEERFQYRAPERTTDEFLAELQSSPLLSSAQKRVLGEFLSRCDLVKFARFEPPESELRELHDHALRLVEETSPLAMAGPPPSADGSGPAGSPPELRGAPVP